MVRHFSSIKTLGYNSFRICTKIAGLNRSSASLKASILSKWRMVFGKLLYKWGAWYLKILLVKETRVRYCVFYEHPCVVFTSLIYSWWLPKFEHFVEIYRIFTLCSLMGQQTNFVFYFGFYWYDVVSFQTRLDFFYKKSWNFSAGVLSWLRGARWCQHQLDNFGRWITNITELLSLPWDLLISHLNFLISEQPLR